MRVRKFCEKCKQLKIYPDFLLSEETKDGYSSRCRNCSTEQDFINNNYSISLKNESTMATLKEKREAAALAAKEAKAFKEVNPKEAEKAPVKKTVSKKTEEVLTEEASTEKKTEKAPVEVKVKKAPVEKKVKEPKVEKAIEALKEEDGELKVVATYQTVQEAADKIGATTDRIKYVLRGHGGSAKGFKLRYLGEEIVVKEKKKKEEIEGEKLTKKERLTQAKEAATSKVEDIPVPSDLDYDEELHEAKDESSEEEIDETDEEVAE